MNCNASTANNNNNNRLSSASQQARLAIVRDSAALSDCMYATERNSGYQGNPYEQLTQKLIEMQNRGDIGADWSVDRVQCTPHYAIFINDQTKEAYIASRGSSSLYSDWITNDFFGFIGVYGRRGIRTLDATRSTVETLQKNGYTVRGTGHSLGGSIIRNVGAALGIPVITFNAPFLQHDIQFNVNMRSDNSGNVLNVTMSGDVVSLIRSPELGLDSYLQSSMTLMDEYCKGLVNAHSMSKIVDALRDGNFDPASTVLEVKTPTKLENESNLLTIAYETEVSIYDEQGEKTTETIKVIQMSVHVEAAVSAAKQTVFASAVNQAMSVKGWNLKNFLDTAVKEGSINAMMAFQTSVMNEQLVKLTGSEMMGRHLTGTTIRVVNALLQSNTKGLKKDIANSAVSYMLEAATDLPLSFREERFSIVGKLFSSKEMTKEVTGLKAEYGIGGGIVVGVHQHQIRTEEKLNNGQIRTGKHGEIGAQASLPGAASISLGLRHGKLQTSVMETTDSNGVTTEKMTKEQYSGKLAGEINIGGRSRTIEILPALQSHKQKISNQYRKDGAPLSSEYNKQLKYLSVGVKGSYDADTTFGHINICDSLFEGARRSDGRDEHIHDITRVDHTKRKFFVFKTKYSDVTVQGTAHEHSTSMSDTQVVRGAHGDEFHNRITEDMADWTTLDTTRSNKKGNSKGPTQHTESKVAEYQSTYDVFSLKDKDAAYDKRDVSQTLKSDSGADMIATGVEKDTSRIVQNNPMLNENGSISTDTLTKVYKHGTAVLKGETSTRIDQFSNGHIRTKEKVEINSAFTDLRSEQKGLEPAKLTKAGEDRECHGTIARTKETTTKSIGKGLKLETKTTATTKVHTFTGETTAGTTTMDIAPNASSHVNVEVTETQGLFTTSITQTEEIVVLDVNDKEVSKTKDNKIGNKLSSSGSAGLWALCDGCYEIIGIMGMIMVEKDEKMKGELWDRFHKRYPTISIDIFETMGIAYSGERGATTACLGDGLPYALAVAALSMILRAVLSNKTNYMNAINDMRRKKRKTWNELAYDTQKYMVALPSVTGVEGCDVFFKVLQLSCQFALVWSEVPFVTNWTFAARNMLQIIHGSYLVCYKNYDSCFDGGLSFRNAPLVAWRVGAVILEQCKIAVPPIVASGAGLVAGIYTSAWLYAAPEGGAAAAMAATEATVLGSAAVVAASALVAFIATGVVTYGIAKGIEWYESCQEVNRILTKYDLKWESDRSTITSKFRKLFLRYHPDKMVGKADEFMQCRADYELLLKECHVRSEKSTLGTMAYALAYNLGSVLAELVPLFDLPREDIEVKLKLIQGDANDNID